MQPARILLVDDDEDTVVVVRELLRRLPAVPYQVDWVSGFDAGREQLRSCGHDAYLIDHQLGERTGLELLRTAVADGCRSPMILLTGQDDVGLDRAAMEAGAADYLIKGQFDAAGLERSIRHALERARRQHVESSLLDSEASYNSLVESLPVCVLRKDLEGRFTYANRAYCEFTKRELSQVLGRTDHDFSPSDVAEKFRRDDERVIATGEQVRDIEVNETDGRTQWVEVIKTPVLNAAGAIVGTQAIFWDVSERQRAVAALREAKEAAEAADRAKSEFLANMSHEIRTPMNGILGMAELLAGTPLSASQRDFLGLIRQSADALLRILNDILDFSKIEAGRMELEEIEFGLQECVGQAVHLLAFRAEEKGIELACRIAPETPNWLVGDPGRLRQVLVNLVGNAIKFTDRGEIVVEIEPAPLSSRAPREGSPQDTILSGDNSLLGDGGPNSDEAPARLRFSVRDTGIGIPADRRQQLFRAFSQGDTSTTRKYGGTGLGLAISSRLVSLMGGELDFSSAVGAGTTFHFDAEFALASEQSRTPSAVLRQLQGVRVLVVDDNATNRRILQELTLNWRMRPELADGAAAGRSAIRAASCDESPFRLILVDYQMPDVDGLQFIEQLQSQSDWHPCPVIMLSSAATGLSADKLRDRGITRCLVKPIIASELLRTILETQGVAFPEDGPESRTPLAPRRILLAEDNLINQRVALGFLERWGQSVVVAEDGQVAVDMSAKEPFDLILMDVQMPRLNGYEATRMIRERERDQGCAPTRIVAMTAEAMSGDRELCLDAGMDDYLGKPIDPDQLYRLVAEVPDDAGRAHRDASELRPASEPASPGDPRVAGVEQPPSDGLDRGPRLDIDWVSVRKRLGGKETLLRDVIGVFLQQAPQLVEDIERGLASQDAAAVRRGGHTLRTAVSYFTDGEVATTAGAIEQAGRAGDLDRAAELLAQLRVELAPLLRAVQDYGMGGA